MSGRGALCRRPALLLSVGAGALCRGPAVLSRALSVYTRRSLCRGPAFFVSGPGAPCVGARRSLRAPLRKLSLEGPGGVSGPGAFCRGPCRGRGPALCIGARRSLCRGRPPCVGARRSLSRPGGPLPSLHVPDRRSLSFRVCPEPGLFDWSSALFNFLCRGPTLCVGHPSALDAMRAPSSDPRATHHLRPPSGPLRVPPRSASPTPIRGPPAAIRQRATYPAHPSITPQLRPASTHQLRSACHPSGTAGPQLRSTCHPANTAARSSDPRATHPAPRDPSSHPNATHPARNLAVWGKIKMKVQKSKNFQVSTFRDLSTFRYFSGLFDISFFWSLFDFSGLFGTFRLFDFSLFWLLFDVSGLFEVLTFVAVLLCFAFSCFSMLFRHFAACMRSYPSAT